VTDQIVSQLLLCGICASHIYQKPEQRGVLHGFIVPALQLRHFLVLPALYSLVDELVERVVDDAEVLPEDSLLGRQGAYTKKVVAVDG